VKVPLTEIYAWVSIEPDGSEEIIAASVPIDDRRTLALPLVGDNLAGVRSLRHLAERAKRDSGCSVRLMRFSTRTTVEELP
jgi:hypothetical protein